MAHWLGECAMAARLRVRVQPTCAGCGHASVECLRILHNRFCPYSVICYPDCLLFLPSLLSLRLPLLYFVGAFRKREIGVRTGCRLGVCHQDYRALLTSVAAHGVLRGQLNEPAAFCLHLPWRCSQATSMGNTSYSNDCSEASAVSLPGVATHRRIPGYGPLSRVVQHW